MDTMDFKDALRSIIKPHNEDPLERLTTPFGEALSKDKVLTEYPRPQFERPSYINLNGLWDYAIQPKKGFPDRYDGQILVPFSPEAILSGVERQLQPGEYLWYRRLLPVDEMDLFNGSRLILHFGAIDYEADIFLNGNKVTSHRGGYLPIDCDITDFLEKGENELTVRVSDPSDAGFQSRGKQILKRGGIFYTAQSGIWQTVWMEWIPATHIEHITIEPDFDRQEVFIEVDTALCDALPMLCICVMTPDAKQVLFRQSLTPKSNLADVHRHHAQSQSYDFTISIPDELFFPWTPEAPALYPVTVTLGRDEVKTYFALRTYTIELSEDKPVFCLNHKPCFLMGVLDQSYWSDGLMTAPSDEALLYDITTMKKLGFNMMRKHLKVESARWYYHCDRLGMIVCQDMINGGGQYRMPFINYLPTVCPSLARHISDQAYHLFAREDEDARDEWEEELADMIDYLKFFPSIAIWCPFNEGWGQFDSVRIAESIRAQDPTRLIDAASGWFDQGAGDFISVHNYFRRLKVAAGEWKKHKKSRAFFLSEYGGFACHIDGHSSVERIFGYKRYDTKEEFSKAYDDLIQKALLPLREQGLSGAVYTQVSDIEEEVNGILTYDRKVVKLNLPETSEESRSKEESSESQPSE